MKIIMHNIKYIKYFINVLSLLLISTALQASDTAPAAAGTWLSILPPLFAIVFALTLKRVIPALFLGVWLGTTLINGLSLHGLWIGMLETFQVYVLGALADPDRAAVTR